MLMGCYATNDMVDMATHILPHLVLWFGCLESQLDHLQVPIPTWNALCSVELHRNSAKSCAFKCAQYRHDHFYHQEGGLQLIWDVLDQDDAIFCHGGHHGGCGHLVYVSLGWRWNFRVCAFACAVHPPSARLNQD